MQELNIFDNVSSAVAVYTPLDSLFSEYRKKRADIERIAQYVAGETDVMAYFMSGAGRKHNFHSLSAAKLFSLEPAIQALDATFWARAMRLTDVLEVMPAEMRNNWNKQIHDHETPTFDPTTVRATLDALLVQRTEFFADRIEGIFRELSDEHLTNKKYGFSQRMILNYMLDYTHLSRRKMNYIHDLRSVIARFAGRPEPHAQHTYTALETSMKTDFMAHGIRSTEERSRFVSTRKGQPTFLFTRCWPIDSTRCLPGAILRPFLRNCANRPPSRNRTFRYVTT